MPANTFKITIAGIDKASAVANKVAQSFKKVIFPAKVAGKAVALVGKDTDFRRASTGLRNIAREAVGVVDNVSLASTALKGMVGLAGAGAFITSAKDWAAKAAGAARFAQTIGMSSQKLQTFVGVGQTFGIDAQATTAAVKTLGNTLEDALYGRNQDAMVMMNRLGIGLHRTKDGAVDASKALGDVADAIERNKGNAQAQQRIAAIFGVSDLLPMLRNGRKGLQQYQAALERTGAIRTPEMEVNANKLQMSFVLAGKALDGIGNRIENWIAPLLSGVLDKFTALEEKHPGVALGAVGAGSVVGTVAGGWGLVKAAKWVGSLFRGGAAVTEKAAGSVAEAAATDAVKVANAQWAEITATQAPGLILQTAARVAPAAAFIAGMWPTPTASQSFEDSLLAKSRGKNRNAALNRAFKFFQTQGWSAAQAAGIVANLDRESGMRSSAVGDGGRAYGLAQWHPDRAAAFARWAGHSLKTSTEQEQLAFIQYELTQGGEKRAGTALWGASTAAEAGAIVSHLYERPADGLDQAAMRAASASKIEVEFKNAPPGTRVTTTKPGSNPPAVRVAHAMPEAAL